jgi:hypothetical protein
MEFAFLFSKMVTGTQKPSKNLVIVLAIALVLIASFSCRKKVDWHPPELEPMPVVNSIIKCGKPISVRVSLTVDFSGKTAPAVTNAVVLLYINNQLAETLEHTGDGLYQSQHIAQEDSEYRCEVAIPGFPLAKCFTRTPKRQEIIKFEHINKAGVDEEGLTHPAVKVTFSNAPSQALYYHIVITIDMHDNWQQPQLLNITDPILLNEGLPIVVFSNERINGDTYTMIINYTTGSASNTNNAGWVTKLYPVQVEIRTICYQYYKFIKQQYLYELSNNEPIFSVGATSTFNLHSNVENGYGIFAAYTSVKSEIIYP